MKVFEITESKIEEGEFRGNKSKEFEETRYSHNIYVDAEKNEKSQYNYIAYFVNPKTDEARFKAGGKTKAKAIDALISKVENNFETQRRVSGAAAVDFNSDFAQNILKDPEEQFYAKIIPGPKLVIAGAQYDDNELLKEFGFTASRQRRANSPMIPLSAKRARNAELVENGRYTLGGETKDGEGNRVFECNFHSVVADKKERERLGVPGFTVGTLRG